VSLPEHLQEAIDSDDCPSRLTPLETIVWASERRRRYEAGEMEAKQPRVMRGQNPAQSEDGGQ